MPQRISDIYPSFRRFSADDPVCDHEYRHPRSVPGQKYPVSGACPLTRHFFSLRACQFYLPVPAHIFQDDKLAHEKVFRTVTTSISVPAAAGRPFRNNSSVSLPAVTAKFFLTANRLSGKGLSGQVFCTSFHVRKTAGVGKRNRTITGRKKNKQLYRKK